LYNLSIIGSENNMEFMLAVLGLIIAMGWLLRAKIKGLKKMKSVCDMKLK